MTDDSNHNDQPQPLLRIVRGEPTPEQLAALVTLVSALASSEGEERAVRRPEWSARHRLVRAPHLLGHRHGPGAWRASAR